MAGWRRGSMATYTQCGGGAGEGVRRLRGRPCLGPLSQQCRRVAGGGASMVEQALWT